MKLIALRDMPSSTGILKPGTSFIAYGQMAEILISSGGAREDTGDELWTGIEWRGDDVVVLASGPSLTQEQCDQVRRWRAAAARRRVIAINTTYQRALWADVLFACDRPWWDEYHAKVVAAKFEGALWTQDVDAARKYELNMISSMPLPGLGKRAGIIHQGQNGGYQAVNLAYQTGAARIILLGFDMKGSHWHGDHPKPLTNPRPDLFALYIRNFAVMARDLRNTDAKVINCTPDSALDCFPTMSLEQMLAQGALERA